MSLIEALSSRSDVATVQKPARMPRISKAVRHAISLLATGECSTIKAAAERANLTREHLSKQLGRPHVQAFCEQKTRKTLAAGQLRASARLLELVDAGSEHVSMHASVHVLRINGIAPPETGGTSVNVNVQPGYVINLGQADSETTKPLIDQEIAPQQLSHMAHAASEPEE